MTDSLSINKCGGCGRAVFDVDPSVYWNEKVYHKSCLRCKFCGVSLSENTVETFENKPYCRTHWPLRHLNNALAIPIRRSDHKVVIYVDPRCGDALAIQRTREAIEFFERKQISPEEVLIINVSNDANRVRWLQEQAGGSKIEYPQIYVADTRVGGANDLILREDVDELLLQQKTPSLSLSFQNDSVEDLSNEAKESNACSESPPVLLGESTPQADSLQLGYVDSWLNGTEWVVKGVFGGIWVASSYLLGFRGKETPQLDSDKETPQPGVEAPACSNDEAPHEDQIEIENESQNPQQQEEPSVPSEDDVFLIESAETQPPTDMEVIRTNWYWRHQRRTFRFTDSNFCRIEPTSKIVRETFDYDDVKELTQTDQHNMIIKFKSNKEWQYIRSNRNLDIIRIIQDHSSAPQDVKVNLAA